MWIKIGSPVWILKNLIQGLSYFLLNIEHIVIYLFLWNMVTRNVLCRNCFTNRVPNIGRVIMLLQNNYRNIYCTVPTSQVLNLTSSTQNISNCTRYSLSGESHYLSCAVPHLYLFKYNIEARNRSVCVHNKTVESQQKPSYQIIFLIS